MEQSESESSDVTSGDESSPEETQNTEMVRLRKELADMPFDELEKLKEKIGMKMYNEAMFGSKSKKNKAQFKRENKNRPMEISSKFRPSRIRNVMTQKKKVHRDPRFDDLSGEFSEQHFNKSYSFISDIKQREKEKISNKLKKEKNEAKKEKLQKLLSKMEQEEKQKKLKESQEAKKTVLKQQEKALVTEGKKPYYLKKSEQKKLELAVKFKELKQSGKLENYLKKKRKKNAAKERKKLPSGVV